jgi:hypothetical protein
VPLGVPLTDAASVPVCGSLGVRLRPSCGESSLIGVALAALLMGVVVLAVVRPETFWRLDGRSLETSIEDEFGYQIENCVRTGADAWRCDYARDALSGFAGRVLVRQRGERCWSASTEWKENAPSESEEGCVSAWQFFGAM